jgi:hypothetical protein
VALLEDLFDFLERAADGLGEHEEHVDERGEVERAEDEVGLPCDGVQTRGNGESEGGVECPVGSLLFGGLVYRENWRIGITYSCERDSLSSHFERVL